MYAVLVWAHVTLMMVAFGASPLGRLGLRYLLSRASGRGSAQALARAFSGIFLLGGISVTLGVGVGLALAWNTGFTQSWVIASLVLITIAGLAGFTLEDRWLKKLCQAEADDFNTILHAKIPLLSALISPVIWLSILWLMIAKPG